MPGGAGPAHPEEVTTSRAHRLTGRQGPHREYVHVFAGLKNQIVGLDPPRPPWSVPVGLHGSPPGARSIRSFRVSCSGRAASASELHRSPRFGMETTFCLNSVRLMLRTNPSPDDFSHAAWRRGCMPGPTSGFLAAIRDRRRSGDSREIVGEIEHVHALSRRSCRTPGGRRISRGRCLAVGGSRHRALADLVRIDDRLGRNGRQDSSTPRSASSWRLKSRIAGRGSASWGFVAGDCRRCHPDRLMPSNTRTNRAA